MTNGMTGRPYFTGPFQLPPRVQLGTDPPLSLWKNYDLLETTENN